MFGTAEFTERGIKFARLGEAFQAGEGTRGQTLRALPWRNVPIYLLGGYRTVTSL